MVTARTPQIEGLDPELSIEAKGAVGKRVSAVTPVRNQDVDVGAISTTELSDDAVSTPKLQDQVVETTKMADLAVTATKIEKWILGKSGTEFPSNPDDGEIIYRTDLNQAFRRDSANLAWIAVDFVENSNRMADGIITSTKIIDAAITTAKIDDLAVNTAKIAAAAISTAKIEDLAVTDAKIDSLTADKITTGSLVATVDITTGLIRTSSSGDRVEIDTDGMNFFIPQADAADREQTIEWIRVGDASKITSIDTVWSDAGDIGFNFTLRPKSDAVLNDMFFTVFDASGNPRSFTAKRDTPKIEHNIFSSGGSLLVDAEFQEVDPRIDFQVGDLRMAFWHGDDLVAFDAEEFRVVDFADQHLMEVLSSPSGSVTALNILVNYGTGGTSEGLQMESVAIGAEDSAGSGWRTLRIPN